MKKWFIGTLTAAILFSVGNSAWAQEGCAQQMFDVIMATPFSSRINRVGDPLQAVLIRPLQLNQIAFLPAGTKLQGQVTAIKNSTFNEAGQIKIRFSKANGIRIMDAQPSTQDGWLKQDDANTPVWTVSSNRSTRLLNMALQRRLGTDRAVWAQILGIQRNIIPDPSTDEFIQEYNRHDVLVGSGDRIQLKTVCP